MHFGSPGEAGITSGRVRAALEFTFWNSAVDSNGEHIIRMALRGLVQIMLKIRVEGRTVT